MNPELRLAPITFSALPGWKDSDFAASFAAFRRSADEIIHTARGFARNAVVSGPRQAWLPACEDALTRKAEGFFEKHFQPWRIEAEGFLTGYYEAEAKGSLSPHPDYPVPIYRKPDELTAFTPEQEKAVGRRYGHHVNGKPQAYFSRAEIEQGALAGRGLELVWLSSWADAFFIHIQGSGRITLREGPTLRLAYAAKNGAPYTPIGRFLIESGAIPREAMSMQALRGWLDNNPNQALDLMRRNESYIFFREAPIADPELGPPGAQQVQLSPFASLAVDREFWAFGTPVFLCTTFAMAEGAPPEKFENLLIAQDTGSAIKGIARGDIFCGSGPRAAHIAGHLKSKADFFALLPKGLAP